VVLDENLGAESFEGVNVSTNAAFADLVTTRKNEFGLTETSQEGSEKNNTRSDFCS